MRACKEGAFRFEQHERLLRFRIDQHLLDEADRVRAPTRQHRFGDHSNMLHLLRHRQVFCYRSRLSTYLRFRLAGLYSLNAQIAPDRSSNSEADINGRGGKWITDCGFSSSAQRIVRRKFLVLVTETPELFSPLGRLFPFRDNVRIPIAGWRPFHSQLRNDASHELRLCIMWDPRDKLRTFFAQVAKNDRFLRWPIHDAYETSIVNLNEPICLRIHTGRSCWVEPVARLLF